MYNIYFSATTIYKLHRCVFKEGTIYVTLTPKLLLLNFQIVISISFADVLGTAIFRIIFMIRKGELKETISTSSLCFN